MPFDCSQANGSKCTPNAGVSKFRFKSGAKHRLRLINSGAEGLQRFTIDEHKMTIIANDFVEVKPYEVTVVTLAIGQRTDIIVEGIGNPGDAFWMRSDISKFCSFTNQPHALAAIYYEDADTSSTPQSTATPYQDNNCATDALELTEPYFQRTPPSQPSITTHIDMEFQANSTGQMVWTMNNQSFRADYKYAPTLEHPHSRANVSFSQPTHPPPRQRRQHLLPQRSRMECLQLRAGYLRPPNPHQYRAPPPPHAPPRTQFLGMTPSSSMRETCANVLPFYLQVLAEGLGQWDGTIVRPENPQYRDTHQMERGDPTQGQAGQSYIVIEWLADNPGVWPMHCHIAWHLSSGMYINVMVGFHRSSFFVRWKADLNRNIPIRYRTTWKSRML